MDSPCIKQTVCKVLKIFQYGKYLVAYVSSNGCHYGVIFFKPEKNLEFFRLKNDPIDGYPGRLE